MIRRRLSGSKAVVDQLPRHQEEGGVGDKHDDDRDDDDGDGNGDDDGDDVGGDGGDDDYDDYGDVELIVHHHFPIELCHLNVDR